MCGEQDSKEHRFQKCKKLLHVREKHHEALHAERTWTQTQRHCGLSPVVAIDYTDHIHAASQPIPIAQPQPVSSRKHVFCDGTTYLGNKPHLAIAGYAIVEAEHMVDQFRLIKRARVWRLPQNSYAAEVTAVLEALNTFDVLTIYSDCQAVVAQL